MTVPNEFVGAWERVEFELGGVPVVNPARTVWVQGHSAYCDLRLPHPDSSDDVQSFAGHTIHRDGRLYFSHDLDLNQGPEAQADEGDVAWCGSDLVETGEFVMDGIAVPYLEVWRRLAWSSNPIIEVTDRGFAHVQVGSHSITIEDRRPSGSFSACYRRDGDVVMQAGPETTTGFQLGMTVGAR